MALNKANISWSGKQIAKMAGNGTFVFNNIIQRSYTWETARKSALIHSMIEGYPIPPFYAKKIDGKIYDFLDGKQRINAIRGYIENEYPLTCVPDVVSTNPDGESKTIILEGLYFKNLPEDLQDAIKDYHFTFYYFEDITPEQTRMLFAKLNNGKPLSTKERNIANCVDIDNVTEIGEHILFQNTLTAKGIETRKQLPIVMKVWMMLYTDIDDVSFDSKTFNEIMQETRMNEAEHDEVVSVLDKIYYVYKSLEDYSDAKVAKNVRKKMVSETHMISLVPFIKKSIDLGISDKAMGEFIVSLFGNNVISDEYENACRGGSAKNSNIKVRHAEIEKVWDNFIENLNDDEDAEESTVDTENDASENFVDGSMNEPEVDNE